MSNLDVYKRRFTELVENMDCKRYKAPEIIGVTYHTFTNMINYGTIPQARTLIRVADYFNVSIEYLIGRTDEDYFDKSKKPVTFHDRLEELRASEGITYFELTKQLYLTSTFTTEWRKKNHVPSLDNLILIADYFKVSIDYLLGRTDNRS